MKKVSLIIIRLLLAVTIVFSMLSGTSTAVFNPDLVMSDPIFNQYNSMNASQINAFLNSFPNSCISTENGFTSPEPTGYNPDDGFLYGGNVSAGTVIYRAAQAYELNPRVILATLQKEQSLVSGGGGCYPNTPDPDDTFQCNLWGNGNIPCTNACPHAGGCIPIAMGNDCPGRCEAASEGFSKQIIQATWKLKFWQQRSLGNIDWNIQKPGWDNSDDLDLCYTGNMTRGTFARGPSYCGATTFYDGWATIDGKATFMGSGATAALYRYTPFYSGNQSFVNIYENWFGSTVVDTNKDKVIVGDWNGDGKDTPAIKRGNTYYFDNNNDGDVNDSGDESYSWGKPTDKPFVGKWNGTNDGLALKRGREYFLDYDNNGSSDKYISWGKPTDAVIVGDWFGSAESGDKLGLKRGREYFLDYDNNGSSDKYISWGRASDQVIIGSWYWSAGAKDKLGLKRGNLYFFDWDNNGSSDASYGWGKATDQVIVGDWYGSPNSKSTIGLKRGSWYFFDFENDGSSNVSYSWGKETDRVMVGNWFGAPNGKDSIGLKRSSNYFLDFDINASSNDSFIYSY